MAYDWGRILAKAINGIFFHVAPDKQLKREESSSILLLKSIFTMLSNCLMLILTISLI